MRFEFKSREQIGLDLLAAWEDFEHVVIRAGEVVSGQEFASQDFTLIPAIEHAERGGYLPRDTWREGLSARCAYLQREKPSNGRMADATDMLREYEAEIREKLGPLAPDNEPSRYVPRGPL